MTDSPPIVHTASPSNALRDFLAWSLVGLVPWYVFTRLIVVLTHDQALFLCLASAAVVMWIFRLVPDFVPGLGLILLVTLLDIVPQEVAFSGFYSKVFFLVFGIFILAAVLAESSWLNRLEAVLVRRDASFMTRLLAVLAAGVLLTLVVPSPLGRASMVQPLVQRFVRRGNVAGNSVLALVHVHATTLISTVILTGNPLNFVLLGMLDEQTRDRFQWLGWLKASSVAGLVFAVGLVGSVFVFSAIARRAGARNPAIPRRDLPELPRQSVRDWGTLGLYLVLGVAIFTRTLHQIPLEWVVLLLAVAVFLFAGISLPSLRSKFDWPTLIFVATVVAWGPMLDHLGLSQWLSAQLPALVPIFQQSLYLGVAVTILGVTLIRLAVPGAPAFIILASTLLPFSEHIGMSPWVLGFIILTLSEGFIWPYQHGVFSQSITMLDSDDIRYRMAGLIAGNLFYFVLRVVAIFASIPWWKALNLI